MRKRTLMLAWLCAGFCAVAAPDEEERSPMYLPDTDVRDVAKFYQQLAGSKMVVGEGVSGKVWIEVTRPITKAKRIEHLEESLIVAGYNLIEVEPGTIRLLGIGEPVPMRELPIIAKIEDLPKGERVVTYVYQLKSRKPAEFAEVLGRMFAQGSDGVPVFAADEKQNSIRLTARTRVIRNLLKVLGELDRPAGK